MRNKENITLYEEMYKYYELYEEALMKLNALIEKEKDEYKDRTDRDARQQDTDKA